MVAQMPELATDPQLAVKVLDLVTNRYHTGMARMSPDGGVQIELPTAGPTPALHAGQRVRFVMAGENGVVSRQSMQRAFVTQVWGRRIHLAPLAEVA